MHLISMDSTNFPPQPNQRSLRYARTDGPASQRVPPRWLCPLFFHCNILHRSDRNASPDPRWSLICCYNAARNNPYKESHHPRYTPLDKVPDTAIKQVGIKRFEDDNADVAWMATYPSS